MARADKSDRETINNAVRDASAIKTGSCQSKLQPNWGRIDLEHALDLGITWNREFWCGSSKGSGSSTGYILLAALNATDLEEDVTALSHLAAKTLEGYCDGVDITLPFFKDLLSDTPVEGTDAVRSLADWSEGSMNDGKGKKRAGSNIWDGEAAKLDPSLEPAKFPHLGALIVLALKSTTTGAWAILMGLVAPSLPTSLPRLEVLKVETWNDHTMAQAPALDAALTGLAFLRAVNLTIYSTASAMRGGVELMHYQMSVEEKLPAVHAAGLLNSNFSRPNLVQPRKIRNGFQTLPII
ncbi:hypothetical protein K438DRAFT_2046937 [Mycena galopus ATCC 62051]|nr:hypothetical protein K438DRAFT_2046937 [Mycena galopus ATCC 62051]